MMLYPSESPHLLCRSHVKVAKRRKSAIGTALLLHPHSLTPSCPHALTSALPGSRPRRQDRKELQPRSTIERTIYRCCAQPFHPTRSCFQTSTCSDGPGRSVIMQSWMNHRCWSLPTTGPPIRLSSHYSLIPRRNSVRACRLPNVGNRCALDYCSAGRSVR